MDMRSRINVALKEAMKARDSTRLSTLRLVNAAIKDREIALRGKGDEISVGDDDILHILGKMVRQRRESVHAYEEGGRLELAERERDEIGVIEEFLPRELNEDETREAIRKAIDQIGAESLRDMGKVMGVLKSKYTGRMDFGRVGPMVKARLA